jgi:transcriptional regulator with XRE-family HTH domain
MPRRKVSLEDGYGDRLKRARMALGMKQAELGAIVDVREFTLSRYENEVAEPDRIFLAGLEYLTGIQRAWVEKGAEPMIKPPAHSAATSQALLDRLEQELGGPDLKVVPYPPAAGMLGMGLDDKLILQGGKVPLREGKIFLVEEGLTVTAGTARKTVRGWHLYHEQDAEDPGTFPSTPVEGTGILVAGRIKWHD